jgi:hypothetical protein
MYGESSARYLFPTEDDDASSEKHEPSRELILDAVEYYKSSRKTGHKKNSKK